MKSILAKLKFKTNFMYKLVLGMTAVSVIGLFGIFFLSNTLVRNTYYRNILEIERLSHYINAARADSLFTSAKQRVSGLVTVMRELPDEDYIRSMAARFAAEHGAIHDVYIGFSDGRFVSGSGRDTLEGYDAVVTPWYLAAAAQPGRVIVTEPFLCRASGYLTIIIAEHVPGLGSVGAAVATSVLKDEIPRYINDLSYAEGSATVLIGNESANVISHSDQSFRPMPDGSMHYAAALPHGTALAANLGVSAITRSDCRVYGDVYVISTPLAETDWTLFSVIPAAPVEAAVNRFIVTVVIAFAVLMLLLFVTIIGVAQHLSRNIDDLRSARDKMRTILDSSPLACFTLDENLNILELNLASVALYKTKDENEFREKFFGLQPEYQPDGSHSAQKMKDLMQQCLEKGSVDFEWVALTTAGEEIPSGMSAAVIFIGDKRSVIVHQRDLRDVLQAVEMATHLERLAYTDALTDLSNRRYFMDAAQKLIAQCEKEGTELSVIIFDLDDFKKVNDTHGHNVGDMVLKITAARARNALKGGTLIARFGGEEFIVAMKEPLEGAETAAVRIKDRLSSSPFVVGTLSLRITASFGVSRKLPNRSLPLDELVGNADKALYMAKHSGKNRVVSNA